MKCWRPAVCCWKANHSPPAASPWPARKCKTGSTPRWLQHSSAACGCCGRPARTQIEDIDLAEIADLAAINATGGFSAAESYAWHRSLIAAHQSEYDHRVAQRILRGARMSAADYIDLLAARKLWINRMQAQLAGFDAVLSPTVPIVAPPIASVVDNDDEFFRVNGLLLGNTSVVNMLDGCAISLPCHTPDQLPVGLMLWHAALHDDGVLDLALQVEAALAASLQ